MDSPEAALVLADAEHFTAELTDRVHQDSRFNLLVPGDNEESIVPEGKALVLPLTVQIHRPAKRAVKILLACPRSDLIPAL